MSKNMHIPGWPESAAAMPSTGSASPINNAFAGGMDFIKNFWGNSASGVPGFVVPTIDLKELEKRIKDLKAVEGWLDVNINMLRTTIQALEVQHSTIATIHAVSDSISANTDAAAKGMMAGMPSSAPAPMASPFSFGHAPEPEAPKPRKRKAKIQANTGLPPGWPTPAAAAPVKAKVKPITVQPDADAPVSAKAAPLAASKVATKVPSKAAKAVAAATETSPMVRGTEQAAASAGAWLHFMQDQFSKVAATTMSGAPKADGRAAAKKGIAPSTTKSVAKSATKTLAKSRR